jgi:hypothetical protein
MATNTDNLTRDQIKNRMLQVAARLWGYSDTVSESSFDPLVGLMFAALASEIEQVYDEVKVSQSRVIERLAQILLPDVATAPQPSHTIIHAIPTESKYIIKKSQHVYYKKQLPTLSASGKEQSKNIFFTPVNDSVLVKATVKYMATPHQLYKVHHALDKEVMATNTVSNAQNDPLNLWIGIDIDQRLNDLRGMSLFFENKNDLERERFYDLLEMCVATCGDRYVELKRGLFKIKNTNQSRLNANTDITSKLENLISDFYSPCFLNIPTTLDIEPTDLEAYPAELEAYYPASQLANMKEKLLWIKIAYPSVLTNKMLADINVSLNCFPAINRQMVELTYRLQEKMNIIPLSADDTYLDLVKIYSAAQMEYQPMQNGTGNYTVRQGSVGRFDTRNANELLSYVMYLLRDESAAFSAMGSDMLQNNVKQLVQLINALQQRLSLDNKRKDTASFLMIQPEKGHENVYIEYWVTQADHASSIRQGTSLQQYSGSGLTSGTIYTVRQTTIAKEKLSPTESINAFKSALLSRGRIVTEQDIRYACFAELGHLIQRVDISTSFAKPHDKAHGFQKVLLVEVVPNTVVKTNIDWGYACSQLQLKLTQQSMQVIPIHVVTKKA